MILKQRALSEATQRDSHEGIAGPSLTGLPAAVPFRVAWNAQDGLVQWRVHRRELHSGCTRSSHERCRHAFARVRPLLDSPITMTTREN